ncbi:MAG TPA: M28 family metallopeptidase [Terriglobales bacterium]|nr:M28 family metallopeptidase [Terriglobales bacterium]
MSQRKTRLAAKAALFVSILILTAATLAQTSAPATKSTRTPRMTKKDVDPAIAAALKNVSAAHIKATIEKLVSFHNRNTISSNDAELLAKGRGVVAARDWIKSEFERYSKSCGGCLEVKLDTFTEPAANRIPKPTEISNVYAVLRGTSEQSPQPIYVVTGHYDSRNSDTLNITDPAPGANDDASGTAVSLECARVLSQQKFPSTIIFLTVAGEEQGLNGARHFAKMAKTEGWNISGVLNNDIVGGNKSKDQDPAIVRVFSEGIPQAATEAELRTIRNLALENDSPSRQLARYARETGAKYVAAPFQAKMIFRRDRFLRGGDHTAFNENGFAAIRFTEYREDFNRQHQNPRTENGIEYGDLPKFVDFEYVANVARINVATLASLASAPAPPSNVKVLTKKLDNDTDLTWEASADGRAVKYEVVWRPTTASEWENAEALGNVTSANFKRSKDNVIFGVRSVDKKGNRSVVVLPTPER